MWALAFAAGVLLADDPHDPGRAAALAASAAVWAACADGLGPRLRLLAVVALVGALRTSLAWLDLRPPVLPPAFSVDDRTPESVTGVITGTVEHGPERRSFLLSSRLGAGGSGRVGIWVVADRTGPMLWPGDRVRVRGRLRRPRGYRVPGALDRARLAALRGAQLELQAERIERIGPLERLGPDEPEPTWNPWRFPARLQAWASARLAARAPDPAAGATARAMIIGDRGGLDPDLAQRFRDAGVAHVLAVSGLHLAVVALLVFAAVRRGWAAVPALAARVEPALAAAVAAAPAAVGFTMITGARTSTVRALVVVLIVLGGLACTRRARIVDALGAAALILLWFQPLSLFDPGFQLSFAATATLALALGARPRPLTRAGRALGRLRQLAAASLWSALATAPLTALSFGAVATGGVVANLVAVPLTELVIVPIGLAGLCLSALWEYGGGLALDLALTAAGWMVAITEAVAARAPVLAVPPPTGVDLAGCALIWVAAVAAARGLWRRRAAAVVAAAGVLVIVGTHLYLTWMEPSARALTRVTFLDVGQGDAAVLELPGGAVWLVDGGGLPFVPHADRLAPAERRRLAQLPGARSVVPFLAARRIDRVDVVVISHPHPDHYEGLRAVVRAVDVGAVWVPRPPPERAPARSYRQLLDELRARGAAVVHPPLDLPHTYGAARVTALGPRYLGTTAASDPVMGANDNSLVLQLDVGGRRVLLAGDVEHEAEELLVARHGRGLGADVVKVPHHGSATSSTAAFVAATAPAWAVVSCGPANRFGFPSETVVARWRAAGATVLRTDRHGAVTVELEPDGTMRVETIDP